MAPILKNRKPEWLKVRAPGGENYSQLKAILREKNLHTVCEEAHCPNIEECWRGGTATLMILGDTCTRGCKFCNVATGKPNGWLDLQEPEKVADALADMNLTYVVLTMVNRDDLPDGGADHVAKTIQLTKEKSPTLLLETLVGDFLGVTKDIKTVLDAGPDVFAHNVETVERLTPQVRDKKASYRQSLKVLELVKQIKPGQVTKSSIMLGLGETENEIYQAMRDLRAVDCDALTLGQYLQPSLNHLPVREYVTPERFAHYRQVGEELGFAYVASGPLVRSSYKAGEYFLENYVKSKHI